MHVFPNFPEARVKTLVPVSIESFDEIDIKVHYIDNLAPLPAILFLTPDKMYSLNRT
jgi:hypothetical protein